jgi:hypothetical protein
MRQLLSYRLKRYRSGSGKREVYVRNVLNDNPSYELQVLPSKGGN